MLRTAETVLAGHAILELTAAKQPGETYAIAFLQTDNPGQSSDAVPSLAWPYSRHLGRAAR